MTPEAFAGVRWPGCCHWPNTGSCPDGSNGTAVAVPANAAPTRWTSYDAAGQQTGTASVASASATASKGAKP